MNKRLNINKTVITVLVLNIIQIATLIGITLYNTLNNISPVLAIRSSYGFLYIIMITVFLISFIAVRDAYALSKADSQSNLLKDTVVQMENLNKTLRAQRHDFMNHLQVVYSLIEMDEYADAKDYIEKIYHDIQKVSRILKTSNPAVNALLQAKLLDCEKKSITADIHVTSQLKDLRIPSWEMCRILGNLIDNAIDSLQEKHENRCLNIEISENLKSYFFRIRDNGRGIAPEIATKVFDAGFTTKGNKGEGMGLAIVKEIMSKYNSRIDVYYEKGMTVFEGTIPRQATN